MRTLFFNPEITVDIWPRIVEALKILNPVITWASGTDIEQYPKTKRISGLVIKNNKLSYGWWKNPKAMAVFMDNNVDDGYEYLGLNQDITDIFDSLNEERNLIKRILREENEWFEDAVDSNVYIPKVGDTFYIPKHKYRVRIKSIKCDKNFIPKEKKESSTGWGIVTFMDYGCQVFIESDAYGKWETSNDREGIKLGWVHVLIDKGYWVQERNMNEQEEDFSWVNLPELPEGDSYVDKVRYALLNTEFDVRILDDNKHYSIYLNNGNNSGTLVNQRKDRFTPEIILPELYDVVDKHRNEWYHPFYMKLYNILRQIK